MAYTNTATAIPKQKTASLADTVFNVAWLAILLGVAMELIMLVLAAYKNRFPAVESIITGLVQKVSWSGLVCTGLAFGKAASNGSPQWMAFAGLFSAPAAFSVARGLHKSTAYALKTTEAGVVAAFPFFIAGLKGLEYAVLGFILGWVSKHALASLRAYAGSGLLIGSTFGTLIAALSTPGGFQSMNILPPLVNEVLFPVGCSLALFAADAIGKKAAGQEASDDD